MTLKEQLESKKKRLTMYYEAEIAVLTSQSYSIAGQSLTRANLGEIRKMIKELEAEVQSLEYQISRKSRGKRRVIRIVPRDL